MSNEITLHDAPPPVVAYAGSEMIAATARALADAHTIGSALCRTTFVPKHFQGKPDDAAAAILYGASINMDPVTALQNVFVIGGKPALYARSMVAIVMSKGHKVWTEEESEGSVTVAGQRAGSDKVERVTWTSEMAQRAGYTTNSKYKSDPRSMLYARASGDVARRIAPDALLGMAHNVEELQIAPDNAPATKPQGMAGLRAAVAPEPTPEPVEYVQADPEPAPKPMTKRTQGQLFALFGQKGISEDQQLAGINYRVGGTYESRADVSEGDARAVIDYLKSLPDADQGRPAPGAAWGEGEQA